MTRRRSCQSGFTLLEVLVATLVMSIAVVGLLSAISTSLRNASGLTDHDRATLLARQKMDELLLDKSAPRLNYFEGSWPPEVTAGKFMGWRARIAPFEMYPEPAPIGAPILERVELEIWWMNGEDRRAFNLEGFRRSTLTPEEAGR